MLDLTAEELTEAHCSLLSALRKCEKVLEYEDMASILTANHEKDTI
jgi:hypothetical protein